MTSFSALAGVLSVVLILGAWTTTPRVNDVAGAATLSSQLGGDIEGPSGRVAVPNFVMDGVHPRQVLVDDTVTWTWTAPKSGRYVFNTHGSEMDTVLMIRSRDARGQGRAVHRSDDTGDVTTSELVIEASAGERIRVRVRAKHSRTGIVALAWREDGDTGARHRMAPGSFATIPASTNTGEKPQSKVWRHDGAWWAVLASAQLSPAGTWLWRLDGDRWSPQLRLSEATDVRADTFSAGAVTHVLLHGPSSSLVSIEYNGSTYVPWADRPGETPISMPGSETATLTVDGAERLWVAYDTSVAVQVRYSDPPYTAFSSPTTLTSSITDDDIAAVTSLAGGRIGVMWSNQSSERFGFRTHQDGTAPGSWTTDEVPAGSSAESVGDGMADDHINMALASDGTVYAAVKTSYDTANHTVIGLLVRHPDGTWDPLHEVAQHGTRPIVLLDEAQDAVRVVFTETEGFNDIVMRTATRQDLDFSGTEVEVLDGAFNNVTSSKPPAGQTPLLLAASQSTVSHTLLSAAPEPEPEPVPEGPVGVWDFSEGSGSVVGDSSGFGNDGVVVGSPDWVAGVDGSALGLGGSDYVVVPDSSSVGLSGPLTVAAWIRPEGVGTQYVVKKAAQGSVDGYEVGLSSSGSVFVRVNHASSGNAFRVDSTSSYPVDGSTWMHVAAVVDASRVRLYIDGVEQGSVAAPGSVGTNGLDLVLGAGEGGFRPLTGGLDQVRLYSGALSAAQVADLATAAAPTS